ncbi:TPA: hypothetical protein ACIAO2_004377, partial [Salmonella enterica subsp. enterica serovar Virchow]
KSLFKMGILFPPRIMLINSTTRFVKIKKTTSKSSAQCSPRPACPLNGSLLMQVQRWSQAAPRLALVWHAGARKRMQNHAPYGCMAYFVKNSGIYGDFLTGYCAASPARRRV